VSWVTWRRGAILALLASVLVVNAHVRGDGNGYYAWLASAVVDRDLDFTNQYRHADPLFRNYVVDPAGQARPEQLTPTGHLINQWAVGPAVLWAPWFLAAHTYVVVSGTDPQDGYATPYLRAVASGSIVYAFLTLLLGIDAARRFGVSANAARVAAVLVLAASSLLIYTYMLPFHVHTSAAFTSALFLWYWISRDGAFKRTDWMIWGACYGLMGMTYQVDCVLGIVAIHAALKSWPERRGNLVIDGLVFAAAALVVGAPHWIGKQIVYGSAFATGYRDEFFWWSPRLLQTLFSTNHGAILWTPLLGIGLIGLWLLRRDSRILWIGLAAVIFYLTIASYQNWHGLSSFGNRFFISLSLPLLIGVAAVADRAIRAGRAGVLATAAVGTLLILWNGGLAFQWLSKMIPNRGPVNRGLVIGQQRQVPHLMTIYGYRYFTDRANLIAEIERRDQLEQSRYFNYR